MVPFTSSGCRLSIGGTVEALQRRRAWGVVRVGQSQASSVCGLLATPGKVEDRVFVWFQGSFKVGLTSNFVK